MLTLACTFAPQARELAFLRAVLHPYLESLGIPAATRDELVLVATELSTNAIEAGRGRGEIEVRVAVDGDSVSIELDDEGAGFHLPPADALPSPLQERGRGLWLVRSLTSDLSVERYPQRTLVRAVRRLGGECVAGNHRDGVSPS